MSKQLFKNVLVTIDQSDKTMTCEFNDYKEARNKHGIKWSEKSFCDWCDKHNIAAIG